MRKGFGFEHILGIFLALICTSLGLVSMVGLSSKTAALKEKIAQAVQTETETETLSTPVSGMNEVLNEYAYSNAENAISFLSTTILLESTDEDEYVNDDGTSTGKYIVCIAEEGTDVYSTPDSSDEDVIIASMEEYAVAVLISEENGWCHIISGDVYGYVLSEDFVFGEEAEELDENTYKEAAILDEDSVYFYELANTSSTVMCILRKGAEYEVGSYSGEIFTEIYVEGVGEGYVSTDAITIETVRRVAVSSEDALEEAQAIEEGIVLAEELGPSFIWPLPYPYYSGYITSFFGYRSDSVGSSYHRGIDIHAPRGTEIYAVMDGVVVENTYQSAEGYMIVIYHGDGLYTVYFHMCAASTLEVGASVVQGQCIGYVGSTGLSSGNHLHFGVGVGGYDQDDLVDPLDYLS